ncbi:MAG: hypothetical protein IKB02_05655 [Clostridia bacterium]|nr:hypothetical protein [Clostridia bacterium]
MRENTIAKIIAFFEGNNDIFNDCIIQLDDYNGYLNDDRYNDMELLNEIYSGTEPLEILRRAFFGHDEDNFHTDSHGGKEYAEFNPNRDYFKFNGYGNLVSTDYPDYSEYIDKYAIEEMSEKRRWIDAIDDNEELTALFDELENESDENDEV